MNKVMSMLTIAAMGTTLFAGCANIQAAAEESYVAVDMQEAGVQFVVDRNDKVLSFSATTLQGEEILVNVDYLGEDIEEAIENVIDTGIELGYINPEATVEDPNAILITAEHYKARNRAQWKTQMKEFLDNKLQGKGIWSVVLDAEEIEEISTKANEYGISVARVRIIMALQKDQPEITFQEFADMTPKEIMQMVKANGPVTDKLTGLDNAIANLEAELLTLDEVADAERIAEIEATLITLNANKVKMQERKATAEANRLERRTANQEAANQWSTEKGARAQNVMNGRATSNSPTPQTINQKRGEVGSRFGN